MLIYENLSIKLTAILAVFFICYSPVATGKFQLINEQIIEHNLKFNNIPIGGLSALYYHPYKKRFLALSDDKGRQGPPRFYELALQKNFLEKQNTVHYQLNIKKQQFLFNRSGRPISIDPEGIFIFSQQIFISTEGRQFKKHQPRKSNFPLRPPALLTFDLTGQLKFPWPLPIVFWPKNIEQLNHWGVKENKAFEALSLDPDNKYFWVGVESSLRQDDSLHATNICHLKKIVTTNKTVAYHYYYSCGQQYIRFNQWDIHYKKLLKQFAYPMAKSIKVQNTVPVMPAHSGYQLRINKELLKGETGLTDFLSLGDKKFLIIERTYLKNVSHINNTISNTKKADAYYVQLVWADCSSASNISHYGSLNKKSFVSCKRTYTIDLQSLLRSAHIQVDNIEGIAIGPKVSENTWLLVLVSDNNFNPAQKTQFLFFHYTPGKFLSYR